MIAKEEINNTFDEAIVEDAVREDSVLASESPALEGVRELLELSHQQSEGSEEIDGVEEVREVKEQDRKSEERDNAGEKEEKEEKRSRDLLYEIQSPDADQPIDIGVAPAPIIEATVGPVEGSNDQYTAASTSQSPPCDYNAEHARMSSPEKVDEVAGDVKDKVSTSPEHAIIVADTMLENGKMEIAELMRAIDEGGLDRRTTADFSASPLVSATPSNKRTPHRKKSVPTPNPKILKNGAVDGESPQIGTTLLRRESLRRKESPRRNKASRTSKSPQKKLLKKRDTLQEREILQKFSDATSPAQGRSEIREDHIEASPINRAMSGKSTNIDLSSCSISQPHTEAILKENRGDAQAELTDALLESKDLQRAVEAIEVCENLDHAQKTDGIEHVQTSTSEARDNDQTNKIIANAEIEQAAKTIAKVCENAELPNRKTRSGARFSDDTSMLKDFLNRAQARKAAKEPPLVMEAPEREKNPRRSPRKATTPRKSSAASPQKPIEKASRPVTPPGKSEINVTDSDEAGDISEPASIRRSARTRLPAPSKTPPGAPSFIPVRRADGTDPVVLQKSQAQELAVVTRANTRRNKGQSKPPLQALQDIPVEVPETTMSSKSRGGNAKAVAWAERLASYHSKDAVEQAEGDHKPQAKKLRGLGAVNGTPAAKRASAMPTSNGTPAPKRRGKVR